MAQLKLCPFTHLRQCGILNQTVKLCVFAHLRPDGSCAVSNSFVLKEAVPLEVPIPNRRRFRPTRGKLQTGNGDATGSVSLPVGGNDYARNLRVFEDEHMGSKTDSSPLAVFGGEGLILNQRLAIEARASRRVMEAELLCE